MEFHQTFLLNVPRLFADRYDRTSTIHFRKVFFPSARRNPSCSPFSRKDTQENRHILYGKNPCILKYAYHASAHTYLHTNSHMDSMTHMESMCERTCNACGRMENMCRKYGIHFATPMQKSMCKLMNIMRSFL